MPIQANRYVPDFAIKINGTELRHGVSVDVLSVSVTDTADRADSFTFTVRDRHPERGRFAGGGRLKWIDDGLFDEQNEVEIELGYVNNRALNFSGLISGVSGSFAESGIPTLTIRGTCMYDKLQRQHRREPFESSTDGGIAQEIALSMGLIPVVDDTFFEHPLVSPNNATLDSILRGRAERLGFEVKVKGRKLYFQRPRYIAEPGVAQTLTWGRDLRSFSFNLVTYGLPTEVTYQGSQTSQGGDRTLFTGTATAGQERGQMGDKTGSQYAARFGRNAILANDHNLTSNAEAKALALAHLEKRSLDYITGHGSCIGMPELVARIVVNLQGLGKRFSGNYYVTSTTHTIDASGYRTEFDVKRNARNDS